MGIWLSILLRYCAPASSDGLQTDGVVSAYQTKGLTHAATAVGPRAPETAKYGRWTAFLRLAQVSSDLANLGLAPHNNVGHLVGVSGLRELIRAAGYPTDREFADVAELDPTVVSRYCSGKSERRPTPAHVRKLAKALRTSISELIPCINYPQDSLVHDLLGEFSSDRDHLRELEQRYRQTAQELGRLHDQHNELDGQFQIARREKSEAEKTVRELEATVRELDGHLRAQANLLESFRQSAAETDRQREQEIADLSAKIEKTRRGEAMRAVLTGVVSLAAGAVLGANVRAPSKNEQ